MKRSFGLTGAALAVALVALPAGAAVTIDQLTGGSEAPQLVAAVAPTSSLVPVDDTSTSTRPAQSSAPRGDSPAERPEQSAATRAEPERPAPATTRRETPEGAVIRLECGPRSAEGVAVIHCGWRGPELDGIAGFRVMRGLDGTVREVARTREHVWSDRDVAAGKRYTYVVEALDAEGRTVAVSNKAPAAIDAPVAPIRLGCVPRSTEGNLAVVCEWSAVERGGVRAYQLWKAVGEGERQLLATFFAEDARRYVDSRVEPGQRLRYAVAAIDGEGNVIAKSEVAAVGLPPEPVRSTTTGSIRPTESTRPGTSVRPTESTRPVPDSGSSTTRA